MLRGGYHRAYAYMRARPAPTEPFLAALTENPLIELDLPGRRDILLAPRPPLLADFLDPDLVLAATKIKMRFRFKVTVEMDAIPLD